MKSRLVWLAAAFVLLAARVEILCYGVGCLFLAVCEGVNYRKEKPEEKPEEDT